MKQSHVETIEASRYIPDIAKAFAGAGIGKSNKVAFLCGNSPEMAMAIYACWEIGAVAVPINTRFPLEKVHGVLDDTGCSAILIGEGIDFSDCPPVRSYPICGLLDMTITGPCILVPGKLSLSGSGFSDIILTSGTSSQKPKAVLHTLQNHYWSAVGSNENIRFSEGDIWLADLPFYHISGFSLLARSIAGKGALGFYPVKDINEAIGSLGITHISVVRQMLYQMIEDSGNMDLLKNLKAILAGGSSIPLWLIEEAVGAGLPIYKTYGMTEMSSQVTTTERLMPESSLDDYGKVLKYNKIKISPENEILVKGKTLFHGYFENKKIYRPFDRSGWFHTGDTGYLDSGGSLRVDKRKDSMFISGGENIFPSEIEEELLNIPGIEEAAVIPLSHKKYGHIPVAFIKAAAGKNMDSLHIKEYLSRSLENYKIPKYYLKWPYQLTGGIKPPVKLLEELAEKQVRDYGS